ncbi:hypothetical protein [Kitasatospora viridis]|uniref:Uncharacterized protein n=1 Tax=Kitasatospora viridis TaxID=281105 RepID=A0A561UIX4_9ACTN|nr:hypothetical protein [Kitasatospora viridis]TWF99300.1 hypothetical protein FHX73_113143 [Kitasatospora viridis]
MQIHLIAPDRYVRASHEIVRHPRLRGTAKALLLWALSLPPGSRETILTIGARMPEGRQAVSNARAQLREEGFLHVRREQDPTKGTWSTRILVSSVPLTTAAEVAEAWAAAGVTATEPSDRKPTLGVRARRAFGSSPKKQNNGEQNNHPPAPEPDPDSPLAAACRALANALSPCARLALGLHEIVNLAPLVVDWLSRDRSEARLAHALTDGLPADPIHAPAAFVRRRLERKMPPAPPFPQQREPVGPPPPLPLRACPTCEAPIRTDLGPGECKACAAARPRLDEAALERNRRGIAQVRGLLQG